MRFEPLIDKATLLRAISAGYDLTGDELRFIAVGYVAACYTLHVAGLPTAFVKLWPDTPMGRKNATRAKAALVLARTMHDRNLPMGCGRRVSALCRSLRLLRTVRYLADMAVRFLGMLDGPKSSQQSEDELYSIQAWGFDQWNRLDEQLETIAGTTK
jgi:hypothetical protein